MAIGEALAVEQGRELIRRTLQAAVDVQIDTIEKKFARTDLRVRNQEIASWSKGANASDNGARNLCVSNRSRVREEVRSRIRGR